MQFILPLELSFLILAANRLPTPGLPVRSIKRKLHAICGNLSPEKTNGICPGINIGGLLKLHKSLLNYNLAIVNRQDKTSISKTEWSPVLNGHVMLNLGDPEWKSYKYSINNNNYKIQKSLTIGFGASNQGKTDAFKNSSSISANFMAYYNYIKIDGSYSKLIRKAGSNYKAHCYSIRGAANIPITKGWIIEPQFMWDCFKGDANYSDASFFDGTDHIVDSGCECYLWEIKK